MKTYNSDKVKMYKAVIDKMTLRQCYEWLQTVNSLTIENEFIIAVKQRIREINKGFTDNLDGDHVVSYEEDGSYIAKITLEAETPEEAEEEFQEYYKIPYIDRGYDCTGQAFTMWHSIFKVNGNYVLYHSVGIDV